MKTDARASVQKPKVRPRAAAVRAGARMTRVKKISLTVDEQVLAEVTKDARRSGHTLSAHVTEALARDVRRRRLHALIEEYESEHGNLGEDELARIRTAWQG